MGRGATEGLGRAPLPRSLSAVLRELRLAAGLSQEGLAHAARVSPRTVSDLERGIHPSARQSTLHALAAVLGPEALARLREASAAGARRSLWLPPALAAPPDDPPFVDRVDALDALEAYWREVEQGATVVVALRADAGTGKSRLARELAERVRSRGATVLAGRWEEGPVDPYGPFVEAMAIDPSAAARVAGPLLEADGQATRWERFEAVRSWFADQTARGPVLCVLDGLQWAPPSDLLLLRHLARSPGSGPLLLLVLQRPGDEVDRALRELAREGRTEVVELTGLDQAAVGTILAAELGLPPPPGLVQLLFERTGGNAYAVASLSRSFRAKWPFPETKWQEQLPSGVVAEAARHVVEARLDALAPHVRDVLELAAVIGVEVPLTLLEAVAPVDGDQLLAVADDAVAARLWEHAADIGGWRFTHPLVQSVLYAGLPKARAARAHERVAAALATGPGSIARRARHLLAASLVADPREVADEAMWAGRQLSEAMVWDEAADLLLGAADALRRVSGAELEECDALLAAGGAALQAMAKHDARPLFRRAAAIAIEHGDPDRLGRAAHGYAHMTKAGRSPIGDEIDWRRALSAGELDRSVRVALLAAVAVDEMLGGDSQEAIRSADEAMALAEVAGAVDGRALALSTRVIAGWGTDRPDERLALAERLTRLGVDAGRTDLRLDGLELQGVPLLELGRRGEFDRVRRALGGEGERAHRRVALAQAAQWSACAELMAGDAVAAADAAAHAVELAAGAPNFAAGYVAQTYSSYRVQGRQDELVYALRSAVEAQPEAAAWRAMLALDSAEAGRLEEATKHFAVLARDRFRRVRRDWTYVVAVAFCAATAALLGDGDAAGVLSDLLAPFAGTLVVVASGTSCEGAVDHYRGLCAGVRTERRTARRLLESALELEHRAGARWAARRTQAALGRWA